MTKNELRRLANAITLSNLHREDVVTLSTFLRSLADEPEADPVEHLPKGRCACGLTWYVHSGFAFEVKQVHCTCGRTVEVNRPSENRTVTEDRARRV